VTNHPIITRFRPEFLHVPVCRSRSPGASVPRPTLTWTVCSGNVNGNSRPDFADVVLYFNQMAWIGENEPISAFEYNGNGRIDFADVV